MHEEVRDAAAFETAVATGEVLVDFWATWCGPCRMMGQVIASEIEPKKPGLKVVKVNVDEAPELAAKFGIMSIPALFCYKNGVQVASFVGVTRAEDILAAY